ncbi:hypothetical protein B0H13DRAFT_2000238, partial [Mycena leptocephala]
VFLYVHYRFLYMSSLLVCFVSLWSEPCILLASPIHTYVPIHLSKSYSASHLYTALGSALCTFLKLLLQSHPIA